MERDVAAELHELHARVCKAIADPKRLLIINQLRDGELSVALTVRAAKFSESARAKIEAAGGTAAEDAA